ncbi:ribonuclease HII [Rubricella aquisinus]|uniref:Ribonuclease HII n=1 Tax=Rubricella aquisinus TaxID=2028108 RepID=A0A840WVF8_9RHOB|nr:ribonuclease HII [Rubricella aquisinus]MBB5514224.1 ribonuclease HII [Rubricella aquisinus]
MPDLSFESLHPSPVCGIDEVGRGPWAGPVMAAAVILDPARIPPGLNDSKKLTAARREALVPQIMEVAQVGIGSASVAEIDEINILQATYLAMRRAIAALPHAPAFALIDGNRLPPDLPCPAQAVIKGDSISLSIAAASIVAKVTRDRIMADLAKAHPGYGWETNAGYGTAAHIAGLERLGVTPHHRRSFKPIHKILGQERIAGH